MRYEVRETSSNGPKAINDVNTHSKCFNTAYSADLWVEKNRNGLKWASCHQLCTTVNTLGMYGEKLSFFRAFGENGQVTARIPKNFPFYDRIVERIGETNETH